MLGGSSFKKTVTARDFLPAFHDFAASPLIRCLFSASPARSRSKLAALVSCVIVTGWYAWGRHLVLAICFAMPVFGVFARSLIERLASARKVRLLVSKDSKCDALPAARETLLQMGLDEVIVNRILLDASGNPEILIGEFDQNNRLASEVGSIPLFDGFQVDPENFKKRSRSRVKVVIVSNVVAIKKIHNHRSHFYGEVLTLSALSGIVGVPKLIRACLDSRTIYESFIVGRNVGSLMSERGASISVQFQAETKYRAGRNWSESEALPKERELAIKAFRSVVSEEFVSQLAHLFESIHNAGVIVLDIKYGNVIIKDDKPFLVDFDVGRIFTKNSIAFEFAKAADRDRFAYFFGNGLSPEP
jgi:tRNA A-37 threonylcarbamoyl transferase component Bud32